MRITDQSKLNGLLITASYTGNLNKVKEAISKGADVNNLNGAPLRHAVRNNNLDVVKYLIKNGANDDISFGLATRERIERIDNDTFQFLKLYRREDKMAKNLVKIMLRGI